MDWFLQIADHFGVPVAVMAAMGVFFWTLWRFATGPLMDRAVVPLVARHIAFLDSIQTARQADDERRVAEHEQVMANLTSIAGGLSEVRQIVVRSEKTVVLPPRANDS